MKLWEERHSKMTEVAEILEVKNLKKYFHVGRNQVIKAVDDVTFMYTRGRPWGWSANRDAASRRSAGR